MREFEDSWNRFAMTGKIEDYLSYRGCAQSAVASVKTGASETGEPLPERERPDVIYQ